MSDEAPELTPDFFKRADIYYGDTLIRPGRRRFLRRFSLRIAGKHGPLYVCPKLFQPLWRARLCNRLRVARTSKAKTRAVRDARKSHPPR